MGAFSGLAPGRFAVTLNAVISDEPAQMALPVVFLLRQVLEEAPDFQAALDTLASTPLASDSLLLLTGVHPNEMAVIERTPSRNAVRRAIDGCIFVTNDYRALRTGLNEIDSELNATTCARFDRLSRLIEERSPESAEACFSYLDDSSVRMGITVQQMVFQASTGLCLVK